VRGAGFAPGEAVLVTFNGPGALGLVAGGGEANASGAFEINTTQAGFRMDTLAALKAGLGTVLVEGSRGSKAAALITLTVAK
jgi:hypothetical protein